jgi:hypothetical protein
MTVFVFDHGKGSDWPVAVHETIGAWRAVCVVRWVMCGVMCGVVCSVRCVGARRVVIWLCVMCGVTCVIFDVWWLFACLSKVVQACTRVQRTLSSLCKCTTERPQW